MLEAAAGHEPPAVGDIEARRAVFAMIMAGAAAADPAAPDVRATDFTLGSRRSTRTRRPSKTVTRGWSGWRNTPTS